MTALLQPDLIQARRFLVALDPSADCRSLIEDYEDGYSFQTFDDKKARKSPSLTSIKHGTLDILADQLSPLNQQGAGVFVTINETDMIGRKLSNITRVRAAWIDDDVGNTPETPLEPHLITETSPGKFHKIFLVDNLTPEQHQGVQNTLVNDYGSDPNAKDLARVLRVPGFYHCKGTTPHRVRIVHESGAKPYSAAELQKAFPPSGAMVKPKVLPAPTAPVEKPEYTPITAEDSRYDSLPDITLENAADYLPTTFGIRQDWLNVGATLHHQFKGSSEALEMFNTWSLSVPGYTTYDDVVKAWKSFKRTTGKQVTFRSLIHEYNKKALQSPLQHEKTIGQADKQFQLVAVKGLIDNPVPLRWTIKGILEKGGMNLMSGPYGSGKSFAVFDMGFCIAEGIDWYGNKVIQSPVIILAGEGHSGIADRFAALEIKYGVHCPGALYVSQVPAQLTDTVNTQWVSNAVNQICPDAGLIIVDTLNRNFGGLDENSTKDMTLFINNLDNAFRSTGKTVIVVHHTGHAEANRGRGNSSLPGACEGEFIIKKQDNGLIITCEKQKNAKRSAPLQFKFKEIDVPGRADDDGEQVTSLVLEHQADAMPTTKRPKLSARDDAILTSLSKAIAAHGVQPTEEIKAKFGGFDSLVGKMQKIVHINHWRELAYKTIPVECKDEEGKADALKKAFKRGRNKLLNNKLTVEQGNYAWLIYD